jgi:geranylgeranyl reductase family protein
MKSYDVVISEAGPAGCSAALFLARKGHKVLLIDKARFPRQKVYGEGLTAASSALLEDLGVMERLRQSSGSLTEFSGVTLVSPVGTVLQGSIGQSGHLKGRCWVIPRTVLDESLVSSAREHSSITFLDQTAVSGLIMDGDRARGVSSSAGEFYGRVIIAADGVYSPVAARLKRANHSRSQQGFAMRAWFSEVDGLQDSIELCYDNALLPGYGWIFPAGHKRANVGVFLLTRFSEQRGMKRLFERFVAENPHAASRLDRALMEPGTLKSWPLPLGSFPGQRGQSNVLLAGDAGSFIDPLTGEGIYYALKSGHYAAEAAAWALDGNCETEALRRYEQLWRQEFAFRVYSFGYAFQPLMKSRFFVNKFIWYTARKQSRANLLAEVVVHKRPRRELLKVFNPFL